MWLYRAIRSDRGLQRPGEHLYRFARSATRKEASWLLTDTANESSRSIGLGIDGANGWSFEKERAHRVMMWADLYGSDLAGVLRLDDEYDSELLSIINDALAAAGDAFYALP